MNGLDVIPHCRICCIFIVLPASSVEGLLVKADIPLYIYII